MINKNCINSANDFFFLLLLVFKTVAAIYFAETTQTHFCSFYRIITVN